MRPGIRTKIGVFTVVTVLVSVAASVTSVGYYLTREYTEALHSRSFAIAKIVRVQLERVLQFGLGIEDLVGFEVQLQAVLRDFEGINYIMVMAPDGRVLFHNDPRLRGTISRDPGTLAAIRSGQEILRADHEHPVEDYDVIVPVFDPAGRHVASIRIGFPLDLIQRKSRIVLITASVIGVSLGALTIVLLLAMLSRLVTTPIRKLLFAVEEIRESGALSAHAVHIDTNDEIGSLATSFNHMMEELRATTVSRDCAAKDISERKRAEEQREQLIRELREALGNVKELSGLLPICASCKKIRDDKGYWNQIEAYISKRSKAAFSHGLCPECVHKYFPNYPEKSAHPGPEGSGPDSPA